MVLPRLPKPIKIIIIAFAIIAIAWIIISSARIIEPGQKGIMVTFGAVDLNKVYGEGLHFINPFAGQTLISISVQTQVVKEQASSASKDLQDVSTTIAINYHLNQDTVNKLYKEVGLAYKDKVITPISQEAVKQITAQYNAADLITLRDAVKQKIQDVLTNKLRPYGIIVEQVSITDFNFSQQFNSAVEEKVTAQQKAQKAQNDLVRIEIEAQQKVATASGQRNATIQIAQGDKESAILKAQGEAEAARIINEQLTKSPLYLDFLKIRTWDGQVSKVIGSGSDQIIALPADLIIRNATNTNSTK